MFAKKTDDNLWLFVGLGNPGAQYAFNRHNIGFMAVDSIAENHSISGFKSKFSGAFCSGKIGDAKVILLKPETYMNNSGKSVAAAAQFYKIPPERIVVFHDELDVATARVKIKQGGGAAGHNGLRSIDTCLGKQNYWRVRIGIGHPGDKSRVHGYVLGDFSKTDEEWLVAVLGSVAEHVELILQDRMNDFVSVVNMDLKDFSPNKKTIEG